MITATDFAERWLRGTTCRHHRNTVHTLTSDHRFIVMKHHGHSEYTGRFSGSVWCGTYYALYDLTQKMPDCLGNPDLMRVEGRWLKRHWDELAQIIIRERGRS